MQFRISDLISTAMHFYIYAIQYKFLYIVLNLKRLFSFGGLKKIFGHYSNFIILVLSNILYLFNLFH